MMRSIRFGVIDSLNPKEKELFDTVFVGLQALGYFTYEQDSPECIRLTKKGYDYIYDEEKKQIILQKAWVIPEVNKTDWDKAYNKLWRIIGPQEGAINYIGGSQFYKYIFDLCDDIPPSYTGFIEQRRKQELSTSRVQYYKDLIDLLDVDKRFELYVNIQLFIEEDSKKDTIEVGELDLPIWDAPEPVQIPTPKVEVAHVAAPPIESIDASHIPTVFISYSWDTPEHEAWVLDLATKLMRNGVDVILDKWDLGKLGRLLPNFMEQSISKSQRVICIMTPNYKKKTDKLEGGVGYEYSIITAEIFGNGINTSKFIPLIRSGADGEAIPTALSGRNYINMRKDEEFDVKMEELLRDIHDEPKYKKPKIGTKPNFD